MSCLFNTSRQFYFGKFSPCYTALLTTRLGAISNCQLPITLEVIANDPITNYFIKKVMGNAPNYPLLFGYISN